MPVQTTNGKLSFPDGAKVLVKEKGAASYTDVGAINSAINLTLNWEESQVNTANFGNTPKRVKNMTVAGGFTLINYDPAVLQKLGCGIFTKVENPGTSISTIPDQVIASGWDDGVIYPLVMYVSSSDSTTIRPSAEPVITSVKLDAAGTPETLTAGNDYVIVKTDGPSGYGISFVSANMTTGSPKTKAITIDYGANASIASVTMYAGSSSKVMDAIEILIQHTDDNGVVDTTFNLPSVEGNSGGFQFNFKGANEDGLNEIPLSFTGKLDTSKVTGRQLFSWDQTI